MRLRTCFVSSLALAASATGQITVPSSVATTRPTLSPFYTSNVFYSTTSTTTAPASRSQTIIDLSDLGNVAPLVAKSIAVRRPIGLGNSNPAMTTNATLVLSVSTALSSAATTTFATNYGASSTTVINTAISLPASVNQATWPAPWQPAFPFNAPFVIPPTSAGGSLVIDLTQVQTAGATSWYVEYTTPDLGGRSTNGAVPSQCKFSGGTYNNSLSYTTGGLRPSGGSWYVQYGGLQPNVIGVIAISAFGVDNKGTWPLPLDLTPLGATNCSFNVGLEIGFLGALTASATGTARTPTMMIPAGLGGSAFYDQTIWFDAAANTAGIVSGWSSKWSIGTGLGAPSAFVYATGNNHTSATGTMITGACPTWQIQ